jgi:hypothetical protein
LTGVSAQFIVKSFGLHERPETTFDVGTRKITTAKMVTASAMRKTRKNLSFFNAAQNSTLIGDLSLSQPGAEDAAAQASNTIALDAPRQAENQNYQDHDDKQTN